MTFRLTPLNADIGIVGSLTMHQAFFAMGAGGFVLFQSEQAVYRNWYAVRTASFRFSARNREKRFQMVRDPFFRSELDAGCEQLDRPLDIRERRYEH